MIIVRVELHSAVTGQVTEIARMLIANDGQGTQTHGDYYCTTFRGRTKDALNNCSVQRKGQTKNYPRLALHVWNLVARCLTAMEYR